jgi:Uncharacterized membrane protein, possible Na+ channel or pump
MFGLGTIINTLSVIVGGLLGIVMKSGLKEKYQNILMQALGLATLFIGISGAMKGMLTIINNEIETQGSMILIVSLVLGALIGEFLDIERRLEYLGEFIKKTVKFKDHSRFVEGFVTSSLVICVGAMAIVGSLQDGLHGDYSMLVAKSVLDFIIVMIFASTLGIGVVFSAFPLFIYQGGMTLFASLLAPLFTQGVITHLSFVGSVLICAVGVNLCFDKKIKVGNMLPAMLIPLFFH